jgi:hypothetical protein
VAAAVPAESKKQSLNHLPLKPITLLSAAVELLELVALELREMILLLIQLPLLPKAVVVEHEQTEPQLELVVLVAV